MFMPHSTPLNIFACIMSLRSWLIPQLVIFEATSKAQILIYIFIPFIAQ